MENNENFNANEKKEPANVGDKKLYVPSLVLTIVGLVFSVLVPLITYICSIIGLALARKKKDEFKVTPAFVIGIISLVIAVIVHIINIYMLWSPQQ